MPDRNDEVPHDPEDKGWWLLHGEALERQFVALCQKHLKLNAVINPAKATDPTAPDLIVEERLADLKTQNTPFFTAQRHGIDPRFAVTFNRKDYERYRDLYPEIDIYFWIDWTQTEWNGRTVEYLGGIFRLPFAQVAQMIEAGAPEHYYQRRQNDIAGNAKSSFVLDIRNFEELFRCDARPN